MIRKTLKATTESTFCVQLPSIAHHGMPTPTGTGFFVSADGWFMTAAHVITENNQPSGPPRKDLDQAWLMKEIRVAEGGPGAMCQAVTFGHIFPEFDVALLKIDFSANAGKGWFKRRSEFPFITVS